MAELSVLQYPDPRLRKKAVAVTKFDAKLAKLATDMFETMYVQEGIGLAATQVDQHVQMIVIDVQTQASEPMVLINPSIIEARGEQISEEGCLSVPEYRAEVTRAEWVHVTARDLQGGTLDFEADAMLAVCVQHEMDHLQGVLFVDHLSRIKQQRYQKRLAKLRRAG